MKNEIINSDGKFKTKCSILIEIKYNHKIDIIAKLLNTRKNHHLFKFMYIERIVSNKIKTSSLYLLKYLEKFLIKIVFKKFA
jgi:hypothetical protein